MCAHTHTRTCVHTHSRQRREETKEEREGYSVGETQHHGGNGGGVGGNERESRDAERKMENIESGEVKEETGGEREKEQKRGS